MTVSSRLVLMFPGFEPLPAEAHCRRFVREAAKNAPLYEMTLSPSALTVEPRSASAIGSGSFSVKAAGNGWATDTEIVIYELERAQRRLCRTQPGFALRAEASSRSPISSSPAPSSVICRPAGAMRFFFIFPLLVIAGAGLAAWLGYVISAAVVTGFARDWPGRWWRSPSRCWCFSLRSSGGISCSSWMTGPSHAIWRAAGARQ